MSYAQPTPPSPRRIELSDSRRYPIQISYVHGHKSSQEENEEDVAEEDSGLSEAAGSEKGFRGVFSFLFFLIPPEDCRQFIDIAVSGARV